jgi:drug/metabolite transporter (DMT)-like permease
MYTGGFFLILLAFAAGEYRFLPPLPILLGTRVLVSMAYLIVAASIIAYTSYVWLIAHDSPTRVASYAYVNPVIALLLGVTLAGESISRRQGLGAALVIVGVFATLMGKRTPRTKDEDPRPRPKISTAGLS